MFIKSNINEETTSILIITSPNFYPLIEKQLQVFDLPLYYFLLDIKSLFNAGCARLHIFLYENINKYEKILYLDTDILINSDINKLFNLDLSSEKIYVLEEGNISQTYYGSWFFDFTKYRTTLSAFTSGIILFKNSDSIKSLFNDVKLHIVDYIYENNNNIPSCLDQPFIVYNAITQNKYDNQILKKYVENNPKIPNPRKIIYHFPGTPGWYDSKIKKMTNFWVKTNKIPKILFQTNKAYPEKYITDMIYINLDSDWKYDFYDDDDVIDFFINNPICDLPDIIERYNSITKNSHKANLFKYYYLYINGGVFMDSDAMIYVNINDIVKDYNFISVNSSAVPSSIFQGILGASPKNEIIKQALYSAYNTDFSLLNNDYHYWCKELYGIINYCTFGYNVKLYKEQIINDFSNIIDENDVVLFKHFFMHKIIPR